MRTAIEQIRIVIEEIEQTFNKKVDKLAKKIERSGSNIPPTSAAMDEMNLEGALILLDEFEKLLSIKLEFTVETINQFVEEAITDLESDLKNQVARLRHQLGATAQNSGIPPETKPKTKSKTQPKKPFLPQLPPLQSPPEDYSGSQKSEVCPRNPMPYAPCPMPYAQSYLIFLRKAI
ncbi:hypothetical protein [Microcoleus anatoxicus]|uniref:Uncharacterized protein n=1 Tax=Microcoleus anatoxicus PTRS2 TaxID=2705321 RepID=A0ABU8YK12_9CYAN